MNLKKCDACGKIVREKEANMISFIEHANAMVMVKNNVGSYTNICDEERDVCRACSIKILKILFPGREFMPEEEYEKKPF